MYPHSWVHDLAKPTRGQRGIVTSKRELFTAEFDFFVVLTLSPLLPRSVGCSARPAPTVTSGLHLSFLNQDGVHARPNAYLVLSYSLYL